MKELGKGQYGAVYKVRQKSTSQIFAAKKLFYKNDDRQEEMILKQPLLTQNRYREIFAKDRAMSVRKLGTGTSKMFLRERLLL